MKKKIIIIMIVIAILIGAMCYGFFFHSYEQPEKEEINSVEIENVQKDENNTIVEDENNVIENIITQEPIEEEPIQQPDTTVNNNVIIGKEEVESNTENDGLTEEEKAIELVKEKWGIQDDNVTYAVANRENSTYIISVTDKQTTAVLAWYQVDMVTEKVEQQ